MHITNVLGIYYAMLKDKTNGGGFIGRGLSYGEAIRACLRSAGLLPKHLFTACECGHTRSIPIRVCN